MKSHRIPALLTALALLLSLTACGGDSASQTPAQSDAGNSVADRFDDMTNTNTPSTSSEAPESTEALPEEGTDEYWFAKAAALNESTAEQHGSYGDNYKWYYGDGVLAVRGTGTLERLDEWDASNNMGKVLSGLPQGDITVVIEDGCTAIGSAAFYECSRLTDIVIADSVKVIKEEPFGNCRGLKKIVLPQSVIVMGTYVFYGCTGLAEVTMPDDLIYMSWDVFRKCSSSTLKQIHWRGETYDSNDSFVAAVKDAGIPVDGTEPTIDDNSGIMDDIHIRVEGDTLYFPGVGSIHREDYGSYSPVNVVVEPGIIGIAEGCFRDCRYLTSITLPDGFTTIGANAFEGCGLTSITIPGSVKTIDKGAFTRCQSLASVTLSNGLESIGSNAFSDCIALTSITLPDSVKTTGTAMFSGCKALTSVTLPGNLERIDNNTFSGCSALTEISIPSSVTSIGQSAFSGCSGLTSVTLPSGLESIGDSAFYSTGLTSIVIPDSVGTLGSYAFHGCASLTEVTLGRGITQLDQKGYFDQCSALTKVKAPSSLQEEAIRSGMDLSMFEWY